MKKGMLLGLALALAGTGSVPAHATCAGGFTLYLAGQLPDFTFTTGVPETLHFNPWYVAFQSNSGSCGIFARSNTPGVSIVQTYGCSGGGCPVVPPGQWAAVGDAYQTSLTAVAHKSTDIPVVFDGSTAAGTYGTIEIAISDNDLGLPPRAIIGVANVYVESAPAPPTWFGVGTNAGNVSGHRVTLDHPYLNGNGDARIFVSHTRNPGGSLFGTSWNHPLAVEYDPLLSRWAIVNADGAAMPTGLGFGVRIDPAAQRYCTSSLPITNTSVLIDHPLTNNNVWATILVTPIGGGAHPIAVRFVTPYWQIVYSDDATIAPSTCFNVKPFAFTQYLDNPASGDLSSRTNVAANWGTGVDAGGAGTGHTSGASRYLQFDWAYQNPYRQVMSTYNLTPLGFHAYFDARYFGLSAPSATVAGGRWAVYHEDGTTMSQGARFNVWAPCAGRAWYPDADGDGYGVPGVAQASCAPLAGYANRGDDCDDLDPTRYPGSREINDGRDNQCAGEPGFGQVDEIGGVAEFFDRETYCWQYQSGATSYQVAISTAASFSPCAYLSTTAGTCQVLADVPPPGQAFYYLVRTPSPWQGSWGADSAGQERSLSCQ